MQNAAHRLESGWPRCVEQCRHEPVEAFGFGFDEVHEFNSVWPQAWVAHQNLGRRAQDPQRRAHLMGQYGPQFSQHSHLRRADEFLFRLLERANHFIIGAR